VQNLTIGWFLFVLHHRDHVVHIDRAKGIECTRCFDMGLTSAEGQKLEYFERMEKKFSLL